VKDLAWYSSCRSWFCFGFNACGLAMDLSRDFAWLMQKSVMVFWESLLALWLGMTSCLGFYPRLTIWCWEVSSPACNSLCSAAELTEGLCFWHNTERTWMMGRKRELFCRTCPGVLSRTGHLGAEGGSCSLRNILHKVSVIFILSVLTPHLCINLPSYRSPVWPLQQTELICGTHTQKGKKSVHLQPILIALLILWMVEQGT
jgi:hypothetical protein